MARALILGFTPGTRVYLDRKVGPVRSGSGGILIEETSAQWRREAALVRARFRLSCQRGMRDLTPRREIMGTQLEIARLRAALVAGRLPVRVRRSGRVRAFAERRPAGTRARRARAAPARPAGGGDDDPPENDVTGGKPPA